MFSIGKICVLVDNSRAGFEKRQKRRQIRALQEAIDKHDTDLVKKCLDDEFDVDFQYRSQTALQLAVKEGCMDICQLLINKGADVNMADAEMNNLLNMACCKGQINRLTYWIATRSESWYALIYEPCCGKRGLNASSL